MKRVVFNDPLVGEYVARNARCHYAHGVDSCIGIVDDSRLLSESGWVVGGAIYQDYTGTSCMTHIAGEGPGWMTRDFIWAGFHYPFVQLDCKILYSVLERANEQALLFDLKLGWRTVVFLPDMFASGDGVVLSMRREQCRWLNLKPRTIRSGESDGR